MSRLDHHEPDMYLTVTQACALAAIGRTTFYKLLDDPGSGLADIVTRIPGLGHIRISRWKFRKWLEGGIVGRRRRNSRGDAGRCQELSTAGLKEIGVRKG